MRIHAARIRQFIDRLDGSVPDQMCYFELVRALYSTPANQGIFSATVAALTIIAMAGALSGDAFYGIFFLGFLIVGGARSGIGLALPADPARSAAISPRSSAGSSARCSEHGALRASSAWPARIPLTFHPGTDVEILISCCVMGYIAGHFVPQCQSTADNDRSDQFHVRPVHARPDLARRHRAQSHWRSSSASFTSARSSSAEPCSTTSCPATKHSDGSRRLLNATH